MSVIKIVTDKQALSVPCIEADPIEARMVIQHLMDTAHYHKKTCVGLAANQIGFNARVFVVRVKGKFLAFINPSFTPAGKKITSTEGCLSFPGKKTTVQRYSLIQTTSSTKNKKSLMLSGLSAIAFQHELDHLNGIVI